MHLYFVIKLENNIRIITWDKDFSNFWQEGTVEFEGIWTSICCCSGASVYFISQPTVRRLSLQGHLMLSCECVSASCAAQRSVYKAKKHTSCFLAGGPTITWYALERAVGSVGDEGEETEKGDGRRRRSMKTRCAKGFGLHAAQESAYSGEAIRCVVWASASLFRLSNSTDTYLQRFCVSGSETRPPNPPRTPQSCSLFSSHRNLFFSFPFFFFYFSFYVCIFF